MNNVLEKAGKPSIAVFPKGQWISNPDPFLNAYGEYSPFPGNYSSFRGIIGIYEKMLLDDKISQVLGAVNSAVKTLGWCFDSPNPEAAAFIREALERLDLRKFISGLLTARVYGFAVFEEVWKSEGGRYVIAEERLLPARKVEFVTDEFAALVSLNYDGREFPLDWFHIFTYPEVMPDSYFYGQSDLRKIYREWYNKDVLKRYRNLGLENFAFPMAVVTYDENRYRHGTPEWDALQSMVAGLKDDARVTLPGTFDPAGKGLMAAASKRSRKRSRRRTRRFPATSDFPTISGLPTRPPGVTPSRVRSSTCSGRQSPTSPRLSRAVSARLSPV